jgi:DNA polymerase III psi subunit
MSLNDIELHPKLLEELYSKSLIVEDEASEIPDMAASNSDIKFLGNNQKNILVCVHYDDSVHLPDAQLDFLSNLLKACRLGLNDVAIMNMKNVANANYNQILNHFKSKVVMLFGITTEKFGFPFSIPQYQVQQFAEQTVIHSPALHDLQQDEPARRKLWAALRKIFNI